MSDIAPINRPAAPSLGQANGNNSYARRSESTAARGGDSVELSNHAQLLSRLTDLPDVRQGLVDQVRAAINAGTYETPDKIDAVISALQDELG